jgi:D-3-phosphoglycerate dehydrogenase
MRVLAIADGLMDAAVLRAGLAVEAALVEDLTVRCWRHPGLVDLQADNLRVELGGPGAIPEPPGVFDGIEGFDALVTQFCPVGASAIGRASRLRAIGVLRAGTENVDAAAARERGVKVVNAPGRNANAVAEFAVGLILAETRNIVRAHAALRAGRWDHSFPNSAAIPELRGRTVGLVGLGQIGRRVAELVTAFGATAAYHDPHVDAPQYRRLDDLGDLAALSDVLTLHARLTKATERIISRDVIGRLPAHATLVNTARSGLVDEPALLAALAEKRISGAAIDTFDNEPLPADSPFLKLDDVTITSHLAGSTLDSTQRTPRILAPRLTAALAQDPQKA